MKPILLIHGGAGSRLLTPDDRQRYHQSLRQILEVVYPRLNKGMTALDAVALATSLLEDDPLYNAGKGSKIQSDGHIRMSAAIMDGAKRRFAGCINVECVRNPVYLAKALLKANDRVLAGKGAECFARDLGMEFASPFTPKQRANFAANKAGKTGTVGAVAIDRQGRLASATSTGGRGFEYPHRVSDTPTVAGNFANKHAAASATGIGEQIVEFAVAANLCTQVEIGQSLRAADAHLLRTAKRQKAQFGWIGVDRSGQVVASTTTRCLIWASASVGGFSYFRKG